MFTQALPMVYGPQLLICDSADCDGTNDYMTTGASLTGAADSKLFTLSFFARFDTDGTTQRIFDAVTSVGGTVNTFEVTRTSLNALVVIAKNTSAATILTWNSSDTYAAGAAWHHVAISLDLADATKRHFVVDGAPVSGSPATYTNDSIDFATNVLDWSIGAQPNGGSKSNMCFAEFYFTIGTYVNLSTTYYLRRLLSSSSKPVYVGGDAALVTGTAPLIYQHLDDGEAVANFATNAGTGGNFSITGTLTTGSTSPSD